MSNPLRAIVVIPTYNEKENIELLLTAIFELKTGLHVLVVDDNSPDGTADVVIRLQPYYPNQLHLLSRSQKEGLGRAYLAGFGWALAQHYDYICSMDADFSHAPTDLPRLLAICAGPTIDMVIGSRYITGGLVANWPLLRILLSRIANWLARSITGMPIKDSTAGFVCYRRTILQHILNVNSIGYSFQIEIKFLAYEYGAKIVELPITFINRVRGSSKMGLIMTGETIFRLIQIKWKSWGKP